MANLLLQVLFIIFPLFLYHAWIKPLINESCRKSAVGILSALATIACMMNPIQIFPEFMFYMTTVPWIFSFVYGGLLVGVNVTLIMVIGYWMMISLNIDAQLPMPVFFGALALTLILIIILHFNKMLKNYRISSSVYLTIVHNILLLAAHYLLQPEFSDSPLLYYICYISINAVCALLAAYLTEFFIEREKLLQEVQRSEKMKLVGQLAASVAHEVRNPLTVVRGFLQIMYEAPDSSGKSRNYIALMLAEMDRAQDIISGYLSLAKPTAEQSAIIDLSKVLKAVNETMIPFAILKNVHLKDEEEPVSFFIEGNEEKVKQVFLNIIKNAIEANPAGGTVETRVYRANQYIVVEIKDNGVGMSREQLDKLGMPFYSTKEQGTGLGLMVCYSIINAMNGRILAESEKGMGTKFTILIPETSSQHADVRTGNAG